MKKIVLLLLVILTIGIGFGCKNNPTKNNDPIFPNEKTDEVYLTVKYKDVTYNISKEDMFVNLRSYVGLAMLVEWADENILTNISKKSLLETLTNSKGFDDVSDVAYIDLVKDSEVLEKLESDKYPNGKDNYTEDELKSLEQRFANKFYNYGYRDEESIKKYYKLEVAKEKLVRDYQEIYYDGGNDFGKGDYQTYWKSNYFNEYDMILIPFESEIACNNTFKELNIKIDDSDKNNVKLVKYDTNEALTPNEIVEAYIKLYNNSNLFKEDVSKPYQLTEGKEYSIVDGKYQFKQDEEGLLHYSSKLVKSLHSDLRDVLEGLTPYSATSTSENPNWYIAKTNEIGGAYYSVLFLAKKDKVPYEDAKPEIKKILLENQLNSEYIQNVMSILRTKLDLVVYDKILQAAYTNKYLVGSIPEVTIDNGDILASFMNKTLTKDEYFNIMDTRFGPYVAGELINYYNVLYDKEINKVYDFTKVGPESDRILDKSTWNSVLEEVSREKEYFESGKYGMYGYTTGFGWENFLQAVYDIRTEKELCFHYLRERILGDYLVKTYSLEYYNENSLYWNKYQAYMQKLADEYFNATGFEFALTYLDKYGNVANPNTWTKEQTALVEEFYGLIVEYLDNNKAAYKEYAELLELKYREAPFLVGNNKSGETFHGMDLSKYKTAGIILIYEDLGTFNNEDLNEGLSKAAKTLWDANPSSTDPEVYGKNGSTYDYIKSDTGYHVYFKIKNNDMNRYEGRNIPSLAEIKTFIKDEDTEDLTDAQKSMVKNYYAGIYKELINIYNTAKTLYTLQGNSEVSLKTNNYTYGVYQKTLSINIMETNAEIKYIIE